MNANSIKRNIASIMDAARLNHVGLFIQHLAFSPFVRIVNYHEVPETQAENFEKQLRYYSTCFVNVDEQTLRDFLDGKKWPHDKPGLVLSFDDGTRTHHDVVAPLLEKYGFTGWFFVPAGWVTDPGKEMPDYVDENVVPLTREQLLYLDKNHVVGCHTETHCRLTAGLSPEKVRFETLDAQKNLEELVGHPVKTFCWVGGEEFTYTKAASDLIRQSYELGFMTNTAVVRPGTDKFQLQRTNIEAENPLSLVRFQLSGLMDIAYYGKRKRVNKLTG